MRTLALAAILAAAGCGGPAVRVLLSSADLGEFSGAAPFAPRPGTDDLVFIAGRGILGVNPERGRLDRLLLEDEPDLLDLAFRSHGELLVLTDKGVSLYFAGRLIRAWPLEAAPGDLLAADGDAVWVAVNRGERGRLLWLDPDTIELRLIAEFDRPVSALAPGGTRGCLLAFGDSVHRLVLRPDASGFDRVFVLAVPGEKIGSLAPDPGNRILYAATGSTTYAYAKGRTLPFHLLGGRIRADGATLFISSPQTGALVSIARADRIVRDLEKAAPKGPLKDPSP